MRELVGVAGDLRVDLVAQLRPRAAVDGDERDRRGDDDDEGDPSCQPPAQAQRAAKAEAAGGQPPARPNRYPTERTVWIGAGLSGRRSFRRR